MCQFFSTIVTKTEILWDLDIDSHEELIKKFKLDDTKTVDCNFVRVETTPEDGDVFNHDLENWITRVDQDFKPDWFHLDAVHSRVLKILPDVFSKRFAIGVKTKISFTSERWFIKDSSRVEAWGSSRVEARDSSRIEARDSSRIEARDSSSVETKENAVTISYESKTITVASEWKLKMTEGPK